MWNRRKVIATCVASEGNTSFFELVHDVNDPMMQVPLELTTVSGVLKMLDEQHDKIDADKTTQPQWVDDYPAFRGSDCSAEAMTEEARETADVAPSKPSYQIAKEESQIRIRDKYNLNSARSTAPSRLLETGTNKTSEEKWQCENCTLINDKTIRNCTACAKTSNMCQSENNKPTANSEDPQQEQCEHCTSNNPVGTKVCSMCCLSQTKYREILLVSNNAAESEAQRKESEPFEDISLLSELCPRMHESEQMSPELKAATRAWEFIDEPQYGVYLEKKQAHEEYAKRTKQEEHMLRSPAPSRNQGAVSKTTQTQADFFQTECNDFFPAVYLSDCSAEAMTKAARKTTDVGQSTPSDQIETGESHKTGREALFGSENQTDSISKSVTRCDDFMRLVNIKQLPKEIDAYKTTQPQWFNDNLALGGSDCSADAMTEGARKTTDVAPSKPSYQISKEESQNKNLSEVLTKSEQASISREGAFSSVPSVLEAIASDFTNTTFSGAPDTEVKNGERSLILIDKSHRWKKKGTLLPKKKKLTKHKLQLESSQEMQSVKIEKQVRTKNRMETLKKLLSDITLQEQSSSSFSTTVASPDNLLPGYQSMSPTVVSNSYPSYPPGTLNTSPVTPVHTTATSKKNPKVYKKSGTENLPNKTSIITSPWRPVISGRQPIGQIPIVDPPNITGAAPSRLIEAGTNKTSEEKWQCEHCTLINDTPTRICTACAKTSNKCQSENYKTTANSDDPQQEQCEHCTSNNPVGTKVCSVCCLSQTKYQEMLLVSNSAAELEAQWKDSEPFEDTLSELFSRELKSATGVWEMIDEQQDKVNLEKKQAHEEYAKRTKQEEHMLRSPATSRNQGAVSKTTQTQADLFQIEFNDFPAVFLSDCSAEVMTKAGLKTATSAPSNPFDQIETGESHKTGREVVFEIGNQTDSMSESVIRCEDFERLVKNKQLPKEKRVRKILSEGKLQSWVDAEIVIRLLDEEFKEDDDTQKWTLDDIIDAVRNCGDHRSSLAYLNQECELCYCLYPMSKIVKLGSCNCNLCEGCVKQFFEVAVREHHVRNWNCPLCKHPNLEDEQESSAYFELLNLMLQNLLAKEIFEILETKLRDWHLQKDPHFRWCAHCVTGFIWDQPDQLEMTCPPCREKTCFKCKKKWESQHRGLTCEQFTQWKIDNDPERQSKGVQLYLEENGIDCPGCKMRYSLAKGGCMHFTCPQCGFQFCSGCQKAFHKDGTCKLLRSCQGMGLHCHHPRDCFYYLRDSDVLQLQKLLKEKKLAFNTDPPETQADRAHCFVMEQKESGVQKKDEACGKETSPGMAGLCSNHYKEYLVSLINKNKIDPIEIMELADLKTLIERDEKQMPPSTENEPETEYRKRVEKFIKEEWKLHR